MHGEREDRLFRYGGQVHLAMSASLQARHQQ